MSAPDKSYKRRNCPSCNGLKVHVCGFADDPDVQECAECEGTGTYDGYKAVQHHWQEIQNAAY